MVGYLRLEERQCDDVIIQDLFIRPALFLIFFTCTSLVITSGVLFPHHGRIEGFPQRLDT